MKLELLENGVQYFDIGAKKHLLFSSQNIDKAENKRYALLFKFTPNPFKGLGQQTVYDVIKMFSESESESEMVEEKPTPIKQVFLESPNMSLNPRLVGRVFRPQPVKNFFCFQSFKRCILDSKFFNYQKHYLTKS